MQSCVKTFPSGKLNKNKNKVELKWQVSYVKFGKLPKLTSRDINSSYITTREREREREKWMPAHPWDEMGSVYLSTKLRISCKIHLTTVCFILKKMKNRMN